MSRSLSAALLVASCSTAAIALEKAMPEPLGPDVVGLIHEAVRVVEGPRERPLRDVGRGTRPEGRLLGLRLGQFQEQLRRLYRDHAIRGHHD